jgi:hypothetical protein
MREAGRKPRVAPRAPIGRGFSLLLAIAMTDSAARMGFLTFLPFLLKIKRCRSPDPHRPDPDLRRRRRQQAGQRLARCRSRHLT